MINKRQTLIYVLFVEFMFSEAIFWPQKLELIHSVKIQINILINGFCKSEQRCAHR